MVFKLTSPAFTHGLQIPSKYTCDGTDDNPPLIIHGVPEKAKSLAIILVDQDAEPGHEPHWLVWNISPETKDIHEHTVPFGAVVGLNHHAKTGYAGPCPPPGRHRYLFTLYALDRKLDLPGDSKLPDLEAAMQQHILATAELMGTYARTNEGPL